MKSTTQSTLLKTTAANPMLADDAIRLRAYELYAKRGMAEGHAVHDWLAAEAELLHGPSRTSRVETKESTSGR
jgi:hypothetical protein